MGLGRLGTAVLCCGGILLAGCGGSSSKTATSATSRTAPAASLTPAMTAQLDRVVALGRQAGLPGVVAAVGVDGGGGWQQAAGSATTPGNQSVTPATHFRIGSITKTFTGTVILQLVDQGKLHLSDTLDRWEPRVQNAGGITVEMLLNMTSGIADEGGAGSTLLKEMAAQPTQPVTAQHIVDLAIAQGPHSPPGQSVYYSDTNFVILGIIAQAVTGQPIGQLITQRLISPLGLSQTSYPSGPAMPAPATTGAIVQKGKPIAVPAIDPSYFGAAGSMISTVGDLTKWARALGTGATLKPATARARLSFRPLTAFTSLPGTPPAVVPVSYGLGVASLGGLLGHNGIIPGYEADAWYLPSRGITVVVLGNGEPITSAGLQQVTDEMAVSIARIVAGSAVQTATAGAPAGPGPLAHRG
jgi:D-alanyl-D-alanine carboxypeptidase